MLDIIFVVVRSVISSTEDEMPRSLPVVLNILEAPSLSMPMKEALDRALFTA